MVSIGRQFQSVATQKNVAFLQMQNGYFVAPVTAPFPPLEAAEWVYMMSSLPEALHTAFGWKSLCAGYHREMRLWKTETTTASKIDPNKANLSICWLNGKGWSSRGSLDKHACSPALNISRCPSKHWEVFWTEITLCAKLGSGRFFVFGHDCICFGTFPWLYHVSNVNGIDSGNVNAPRNNVVSCQRRREMSDFMTPCPTISPQTLGCVGGVNTP